MASRDIKDLIPQMQELVNKWLELCKSNKLDILVYCTYRSNAEQDELYKIGRTVKGKIVTNAKGGQSAHNVRKALDFVPLTNGKPNWNDKKQYEQAILLAESVGLESLAKSKFPELAHLQMKDWKNA